MEPEKSAANILVVDDSLTNLKSAKLALNDLGNVFTAPSAAKMFALLDSVIPDLILLDINMPEMSGLEAIALLKKDPRTLDVPVIFLTSRTDSGSELQGLHLGAVDYIGKPFDSHLLKMRVEIHLVMRNQRRALESQSLELRKFNDNLQEMVREETEKVVRLQGAIFHAVVDLVESRDDITGGHISRTMKWLKHLVDGLLERGLYREEIQEWNLSVFLQSSTLHDVGKISISDAILKKPGKLTEEEFAAMKLHTTFGAEIIDKIKASLPEKDSSFLYHARVLALTHHEKWDGTGYPQNLAGENIPLQGRLMAISDVYDALVSKRPYKEPFSHEEATRIIVDGAGKHFDPTLVKVFESVASKFREDS
ncbi:MAG: response regulator [Deltaproteobacteria bacterium]|jgi:putative two-component system response regulator|nr:response regulator [Deltaproteobacteria bacterium]